LPASWCCSLQPSTDSGRDTSSDRLQLHMTRQHRNIDHQTNRRAQPQPSAAVQTCTT
jgi:hypothetical protein